MVTSSRSPSENGSVISNESGKPSSGRRSPQNGMTQQKVTKEESRKRNGETLPHLVPSLPLLCKHAHACTHTRTYTQCASIPGVSILPCESWSLLWTLSDCCILLHELVSPPRPPIYKEVIDRGKFVLEKSDVCLEPFLILGWNDMIFNTKSNKLTDFQNPYLGGFPPTSFP